MNADRFPGRVALQQRVLPAYRAAFFDILAPVCDGGLSVFAGQPLPQEHITASQNLQAAHYVAGRVRRVQDILGEPIALENASYYAQPDRDMSEAEFITAVLQESGCELLLDVNNIYVNSINHGYDPLAFLDALPLERARYIHVAGHYDEADDLKVDTHGADVIDPVWTLLGEAYRRLGPLPTLLERDFNLPPLADLLDEVAQIRALQAREGATAAAATAAATSAAAATAAAATGS